MDMLSVEVVVVVYPVHHGIILQIQHLVLEMKDLEDFLIHPQALHQVLLSKVGIFMAVVAVDGMEEVQLKVQETRVAVEVDMSVDMG
jgi:hypothetical protein